MEKTIYFTIHTIKGFATIKSKYLTIDEEDQNIEVIHPALLGEMYRLAEKYNNRGYAVLFELE